MPREGDHPSSEESSVNTEPGKAHAQLPKKRRKNDFIKRPTEFAKPITASGKKVLKKGEKIHNQDAG